MPSCGDASFSILREQQPTSVGMKHAGWQAYHGHDGHSQGTLPASRFRRVGADQGFHEELHVLNGLFLWNLSTHVCHTLELRQSSNTRLGDAVTEEQRTELRGDK